MGDGFERFLRSRHPGYRPSPEQDRRNPEVFIFLKATIGQGNSLLTELSMSGILAKNWKTDRYLFDGRAIWFESKPHFSFSRNGVFCALFIDIFRERQVVTWKRN
jgi:hypothetical protein